RGPTHPQNEPLPRARDFLQRQRADRFEFEIELAVHMVAHRARNADAADRAFRFQPGGNVDTIAMQVRAVRYHVADVDTHAEADTPVRRLVAVMGRYPLLHLDRAAYR